MYRPRIIPLLLLKGKGLVKSVRFRDHRYLGDPIHAVRLFTEQKADELVFLDILATQEKRSIRLDFVQQVAEESRMPFGVGGGIRTLEEIGALTAAGAEKVILGTVAGERPEFVREASEAFGSSTISVCLDWGPNWLGKPTVWVRSGRKSLAYAPEVFAKMMEESGAGELIVQSVQGDGKMRGYDLALIRKISAAVSIPVVAAGGAGQLADLKEVVSEGYASAAAAGSLFVYHGRRNAVLIHYPKQELGELFKK
jgi:imidazole glycerol-phosphate synthase subunit HisF